METACECGHHADRERKGQHRPIQPCRGQQTHVIRAICRQPLDAVHGKDHSDRSANQRHDCGFGNGEADDAGASGAKGQTRGKLGSSRRHAREQQVGEACAGGQQQERRCGQEHQQTKAALARIDLTYRHQLDDRLGLEVRHLHTGQLVHDALELLPASFEASCGSQPNEYTVIPTLVLEFAVGRCDRFPDIHT